MERPALVRLGACAAALLIAACGSSGRGAGRPAAPDPAEAARREAFTVTTAEMISAVARDGGHLYWADPGGVHRRPLGGADAGASRRLTEATVGWSEVSAMAVAGDRLYLSDGVAVYVMPAAGGDPEPVGSLVDIGAGQPIAGLAATGTGELIVATWDSILRVPARGAPAVLAAGQVRITSVAAAGDHVYWTDYGEDPNAVPPPTPYYYSDPSLFLDGPGAVRRVSLRGGPVADLATSQRGPGSVAIWGDRVWWTGDRGPGVQSASLDGSGVRVEVAGRAGRIVRDDAGLIVQHLNGLVAEWSGAPTGEVRMVPDGRWQPAGRGFVADRDWVYLIVMRPYEPGQAVIAVPRQGEAVDVVATTGDSLLRVRARDGVVWWVEAVRGSGGIAIGRRAPGGEPRRVARHDGYITDVAAGDGELYFTEDAAIYRVTDGGTLRRFATSHGYAVGLTVHRRHVFWIDGNVLMAKKRRGGQPFAFARTGSYGYSDLGADLVFDDDYAYVSSYIASGMAILRISERGEVAVVWDGAATGVQPNRDLAAVGGELFFSATSSSYTPSVYRLSGEGDGAPLVSFSGGDRYIHELTSGGGFLYVTMMANDVTELVRVDPSTGSASVVLRWQQYAGDVGVLTADDSGAYVAIEPYDAVIRVAHDAPALAR